MKPIINKINFLFVAVFFALIPIMGFGQSSQTIIVVGAGNFIVPCGVTSITVTCWGGGGGGGLASGNNSAGGGGAGGNVTILTYNGLTPGQSIPYSIGDGGASATQGVSTWFSAAGTQNATGGQPGNSASVNSTTATGATATTTGCVGTTVYSGGNGGTGGASGASGGGGGGSAGSGTNGNSASGVTGGVAVAGGGAGANGVTTSADGAVGSNPGGGGAGGRAGNNTDRLGGKGGAGKIVITYTGPNAGPDQTLAACATSATLAANTPAGAGSIGTWTCISGCTGVTFSNATSPTSTVSGLTIGTNTVLQWTWTGGGTGCTSSNDQVTINTTQGPGCWIYCIPSFTTSVEPISSVTFNTINNTSANVCASGSMFEDFTSVSTTVVAGSPYTLTVVGNTCGNFTNYIRAYFDWNNNGSYVDAGESYALGTITNTTAGSLALSITIPAGATLGTTRMRIMKRYNTDPTNPCLTGAGYGQAEDYSISIIAPVACSGTPTAGTAQASPTAVCSGFSSVITLTGATVASGLTYQWQQSNDGSTSWINAVGGSGATTSSYTTPGLTAAIYYRCVVTCTNSGIASTSTPLMVSVVGSNGVYRTVNTTNGQLPWNTSTTWECGLIPPTDGSADVLIQSPPTTNLNLNFVNFPATAINVNSITIQSNASLSMSTENVIHICRGALTVNSGGLFGVRNWTAAGIQTIRIGGNILNNGTIGQGFSSGTYDYTIELNGTSAQSFSGTGISTFIGGKDVAASQLVISNSSLGGVTLAMNFGQGNGSGIAGKVIINNGSVLRFSSSSIQIVNGSTNQLDLIGTTELKAGTFNGHYAMTGIKTINTSTSRIIFTNAASNITPVSNIPSADLGSVTTAMGASGLLTIGANTNVYGELAMESGNISTAAANLLTVGISTAIPGTVNWTSGTVVGPLRRWMKNTTNSGNLTGVFPVGNDPGTGVLNRWALLEYSSAPTTAGYMTIEFKGVNPTSTTAAMNGMPMPEGGVSLDFIASEGYWEAVPGALAGGNYSMTVRANTFGSILNYTSSRLIKSPDPHTVWTLNGAHGSISGVATDFNLSRTGMSGYSFFAIAYPSVPLPVTLIDFSAVCEESYVKIKWSTASENNSQYFKLEHSTDAQLWNTINTISAEGYSNSVLEYSVRHDVAIRELNYYRLTQVDTDGKQVVYSIITTDCEGTNEIIYTYPNPSSGSFTLILDKELSIGDCKLRVSDNKGMLVKALSLSIEPGTESVMINDLMLNPGVYYLQLYSDAYGSTIIKHMIR